MATHSSVLAWRIPGMGEPGGLPSMGSHRVGHDWRDLAAAAAGKNSGVGSHSFLQGNLIDSGIEPRSPALWNDSTIWATWETHLCIEIYVKNIIKLNKIEKILILIRTGLGNNFKWSFQIPKYVWDLWEIKRHWRL